MSPVKTAFIIVCCAYAAAGGIDWAIKHTRQPRVEIITAKGVFTK